MEEDDEGRLLAVSNALGRQRNETAGMDVAVELLRLVGTGVWGCGSLTAGVGMGPPKCDTAYVGSQRAQALLLSCTPGENPGLGLCSLARGRRPRLTSAFTAHVWPTTSVTQGVMSRYRRCY